MIELKLKTIIKKKGFGGTSYRELAKMIGIAHVPLWKMINGAPYNPSLDMLDKICTFFKCKPENLLEYHRNEAKKII